MKNLDKANYLCVRFTIIYGDKFTKNLQDEQIASILKDDWNRNISQFSFETIKKSADHWIDNNPWPPSPNEFVKLCNMASPSRHQSTIPTPQQVIEKAIRREFDHPLVKVIFDKLTSWSFSHDTESELLRKVNAIYKDELRNLQLGNQIENKSVDTSKDLTDRICTTTKVDKHLPQFLNLKIN